MLTVSCLSTWIGHSPFKRLPSSPFCSHTCDCIMTRCHIAKVKLENVLQRHKHLRASLKSVEDFALLKSQENRL